MPNPCSTSLRVAAIGALLALFAGCAREGGPTPAGEDTTTLTLPALDTGTGFWADPDPAFDWDRRLGVVELIDAEWCLTIHNEALAAGAPVLIVAPDSAELHLWAGQVIAPREQSCSDPGAGGPFLDDPDGFSYTVEPEPDVSDGVFIVVVPPLPRPYLRDFRFHSDLDGGTPERFESCTSFEGIHLRVLGADLEPRWQRYYYLGYDVEATCPELRESRGRIAAKE